MEEIPGRPALSLFGGVASLASDRLGVASCRHWSALLQLHRSCPSGFDGTALVAALFEQISINWRSCLAARSRQPSTENWRWHRPKLDISPTNNSPEVAFERAAVKAAVANGRTDWANQVPIASGIVAGDNRRAIDLVYQRGQDAFDLLELKIGSDNPLYAAIEILRYGLVWLLSRRDRVLLGYAGKALIEATDIRLCVLAPHRYYRDLDLSWMADGISAGLAGIAESDGVRLSFGFETFPQWFSWPGADPDAVPGALDGRTQL